MPDSPVFRPRPLRARRNTPSLVDVVLDRAQRDAVESPAGNALLVLGEAGHGKTTVGLHRLAHLWRSSRAPLRAAVVVPGEGLARLLQPLLRRLGVDVEVLTYDRWASSQARRAFRRLPRESDATPPGVMSLKRHPALRLALEELAAREPGRIDDEPDGRPSRVTGSVTRGDLQHLFGDRVLLERIARVGGISELAVRDTLERSRLQFTATAEREWAHVTDRERLIAVDRRALDDGTSTGCANTVDVEDYAVLFELDGLRAARTGRPPARRRKVDVLMIDEAQELAPLELALLGSTLEAEGTLIVAGDAQQHTDDTATFPGWGSVMKELGREVHEAVTLDIGYRCPPDVVSLARSILDPSTPIAAYPAAPVRAFDDERALDAWLADALHLLQRHDRRSSAAIVCRSPLRARRLVAALHARQVPARLVFDGRFPARGVQVSTVPEIKGLEFDFVVVPDASVRDYPDDEASRRALYVAVTRARHQAVLACTGEPSAICRPGRGHGPSASV